MTLAELPCSECLTETRLEFLQDGCTLAPFAGLLCPPCYARLEADAHDDARCSCASCTRVARTRQRLEEAADAHTHGGLRADFHVLFGGSIEP